MTDDDTPEVCIFCQEPMPPPDSPLRARWVVALELRDGKHFVCPRCFDEGLS